MRTPLLSALVLLLLTGCASTPGAGGSYERVARAEVDRYGERFFPGREGWAPESGTRTGTLSDGDSERISVPVEGGVEYGVIAGCDQDCTDLDLEIRDERGTTLDSDHAGDDYPVLRFRPRTSGTLRLEVRMYDCDVSPCWYAYRVYRR